MSISGSGINEFSFKSREAALRRFQSEKFDLLVIGGGITGAATARDAVSRGLKVALIERSDFASGTSSRSSKLIHGGLRYLQNFELGLVFEALSERALLLKSVPNMVRPLPFYLPVYRTDKNGRGILSLGLWLYDLLALFRTPGFHKRLSKKSMLEQIPFLKGDDLVGGFRYFDASMWDDALAVETLRAAHSGGAAVANYIEAIAPLWTGDQITGFRLRDLEKPYGEGEINVSAQRVVICAGPWTDQLGSKLSANWRNWLSPSKGVHLIFDLKRLPVPGALVMNHPEDGRISFVIPRPDFGAGIVIVGTTDGPAPKDPAQVDIDTADVQYLIELLNKYFPSLKITSSDILSAYVGVRPLVGGGGGMVGGEGQTQDPSTSALVLQKVSREHHIDAGPGGTVIVAGGKYTTHRRMAQEIVDTTLRFWRKDARQGKMSAPPVETGPSMTKHPVNPRATFEAIENARAQARRNSVNVPEELFSRYGAEALDILEIHSTSDLALKQLKDPEGFPLLAAQLRYAIRAGMVMHLEDFYFRRIPLYASRADHGLPWGEMLSQVWAEEMGLEKADAEREFNRLHAEVERRSAWMARL